MAEPDAETERDAEATGESGPGRPSAFFEAHATRLAETAARGPLLDLACGRGRHALAAARWGHAVVAVDRNAEYLDPLSRVSVQPPGRIEIEAIDLETEPPPDLGEGRLGAVVVSRFLYRPLFPVIERALAPGGLLLYETFTRAQRALGWGPSRDAFLLAPGELARAFPGLETLEYEEGPSRDERPAETARLLARRPVGAGRGR